MPAPIRLMVFEGYSPGYNFYSAYGALTRPLLKRGASGIAVKELQGLLEQRLQRSVGITGTFDAATEAAVLDFQRMYGGTLAVDGIVGKNTWTALLGQEVTISSGGGTPSHDSDGDISVHGDAGLPAAGMSPVAKAGIAAAIVAGAYFLFARK